MGQPVIDKRQLQVLNIILAKWPSLYYTLNKYSEGALL